jgi:multiple sugar transport system permease protein
MLCAGTACLLSGLLAAAEPVTLRFACTDGAESMPILRQVVADFEQAHPGIHVRIEPVVDNYARKLLTMVAARLQPDVARMGIGEHIRFADRNALLPLDPFIARDPDVRLEDYFPNSVRFHSHHGKLYALPAALMPTGLVYYNKKIFREAGIPFPDGTWTWSYEPRPQLRDKCFTWVMQQLTKREGRRTTQFGFAPAWPQLWFFTLLNARGLKAWDSNENPTEMRATDPEVVDLMRFVAATVKEYRWLPSQIEMTTQNTNVRDQFIQGRIAMYQSGPWEIKKFRDQMKDDWDIAVFPAYEGMPLRTFGEGYGTAIFSATKHPEEAWKFVKWISGPPGMTAFAKAGLDMPALRPLAEKRGVWLPEDRTIRPLNVAITVTAGAAMDRDIVPDWFAPTADRVQGIAWGVLNENMPVEQTMARLQRDGTHDIQEAARRQQSRQPYPFLPALILGIGMFLGAAAWVYWPERGTRLTRQQQKENLSSYLFLIPWLLGLGLTFGPMIYSFLLSFSDSDIIQRPNWVGLDNYVTAIRYDDTVPISLRQTFIFAIFGIPIGMVSALALALLLNQRVRGVPLFRALYYLPSLASGVAMSLIWMRIFNPEEGLLNLFLYGPDGDWPLGSFLSRWIGTPGDPINWLGNTSTVIPAFVIMGLWGAGGGTIIFLAGLQGISQHYYEAATIDGAGPANRFRHVTLPLLSPTIFFSLVTGVIGTLQTFTQALVMTDGGPDRATYFYMLNLYRRAFGELQMGYASALAWILFVIILAITIFQLKTSKKWVFAEGADERGGVFGVAKAGGKRG